MKDFFISYNHNDQAWAVWIAWTLEEVGYSTVIQAWDFRPGGNFVIEMQKATTGTRCTVAVLSEHYLVAEYTQSEWVDALRRDPQGNQRTLLPVRIAPCRPQGLLASIIYVDLVGLAQAEAREVLLDALRERAKPDEPPEFPGSDTLESSSGSSVSAGERGVTIGGSVSDSVIITGDGNQIHMPPEGARFPGLELSSPTGSHALAIWREKLGFLLAQEPLITDPAQKFALKKQIAEAESKVQKLGG